MRSAAACFIVLGLAGSPAAAQTVSVVQTRRANVYGLVQAGGQGGAVTVRQTGSANMVGIMQATPRNDVTVRQSGRLNGAIVGQTTWTRPDRRTFMP